MLCRRKGEPKLRLKIGKDERKCYHCGMMCSNKSCLVGHLKYAHNETEITHVMIIHAKSRVNDEIKENTNENKDNKNKVRKHEGFRKKLLISLLVYNCPECKKSLSTLLSLKRHMKN